VGVADVLRITLLGSVDAWVDGERLPLGSPLQRTLFAMLAVEAGTAVPVERLVDALWGEALPGDPRALVHSYSSRLRKVLRTAGVEIGKRAAGYVLEVEPQVVDLHAARALVREQELKKALDLWPEHALGGLTDSDVVAALRTKLAAERLSVAEAWAAEALDAGEHVLAELTNLAAANPLRESLVRLELIALYRAGRQADALRRYEQTRELLADELGIDPGAELREVHARILRADPALDAPEEQVVALPFDVPDFTGRAEELAGLGSGHQVVVVDGMAGVGKTALVVHAVHRLGERFPDARIFVDLHGFTPGREPVTAHAALQHLLQAVGVPSSRIPGDLDQRVLAWRAEMARRRAIVVLDNAASAEQVRPLLVGAPGSLTLVTSRLRLMVDGAAAMSLDVLSADDATALVTGVVGQRAAAEPEAVAALVETCGRLPLALRIAAARLVSRPKWTVADLVERLREHRRTLPELTAGDRNVVASFLLSYDQLTVAQQRMFTLLGGLPGPDADAHGAAALADVSFHDARDLLEDLLDHHLLVQHVRGRYTFHDLVREFARSLSDDEPRGLLDYYLHVANTAAHILQPGRPDSSPKVDRVPLEPPVLRSTGDAMTWLRTERENLLAAARLLAEAGHDHNTWALTRDIGHSLIITHRLDDLDELHVLALAAARRSNDLDKEMGVAFGLANLAYGRCRYREALEHAEHARALAHELGNMRWEGDSQAMKAMVLHRLGRFGEALAVAEEGLVPQRIVESFRIYAICVSNMGRAHLARGDAEKALGRFTESLDLVRELGEQSEEASILCGLGATHSVLGEHDRALTLLAEGLALAEQVGNDHYVMRGLIKTAGAMRRAGRLDEARSFAHKAFEALGHGVALDHLSTMHNVMGAIELAAGRHREAAEQHRAALAIAEKIEYRIEEAHALDGLARALPDHVDHRVRADELCREMGARLL
jgi:DNA-binding SARP family transcriptional activator